MKKVFIGACLILCSCAQNKPLTPVHSSYVSAPVQREQKQEQVQESAQEQPNKLPSETISKEPDTKEKPRKIKNRQCEDLPAVQIFKVANGFSLAHACKKEAESDELSCHGHVVYITRKEDSLHYKSQIIKPNKGKCFSYNGTFMLTGDNDKEMPIPKAEFVDNMVDEFDPNLLFGSH